MGWMAVFARARTLVRVRPLLGHSCQELRVRLQSRVQRIALPFRLAVSCVRFRRSFLQLFPSLSRHAIDRLDPNAWPDRIVDGPHAGVQAEPQGHYCTRTVEAWRWRTCSESRVRLMMLANTHGYIIRVKMHSAHDRSRGKLSEERPEPARGRRGRPRGAHGERRVL